MVAEPSQIKFQPQISAQSQQESTTLKGMEIVTSAKVEHHIKSNGVTGFLLTKIYSKFQNEGGNIVQPVQRLVQIVQDLSYDKIEGEVEKIHTVVRYFPKKEINS